MGILSWIVVGLLAGLIAKALMPGKDPGGIIITILIGIAGAMLGGLVSAGLGLGGLAGYSLRTLIIAVVGSLLLLLLYRMVFRRGVVAR